MRDWLMKYKVGDKVRISKELAKCPFINKSGKMNHWAGKVMTIKSIETCYYCMKEDKGNWAWDDEMISGLVETPKPQFTTDKTRGFKSIYINGITIAIPIDTIVGIAYKNPNDEYDEERGKSLAYYRMEGQE